MAKMTKAAAVEMACPKVDKHWVANRVIKWVIVNCFLAALPLIVILFLVITDTNLAPSNIWVNLLALSLVMSISLLDEIVTLILQTSWKVGVANYIKYILWITIFAFFVILIMYITYFVVSYLTEWDFGGIAVTAIIIAMGFVVVGCVIECIIVNTEHKIEHIKKVEAIKIGIKIGETNTARGAKK